LALYNTSFFEPSIQVSFILLDCFVYGESISQLSVFVQRLSGECSNVVIFPLVFHITVQQSLKPSYTVPRFSLNNELRTRQHVKEHQFKLLFV